jgi:hypothetical protein
MMRSGPIAHIARTQTMTSKVLIPILPTIALPPSC